MGQDKRRFRVGLLTAAITDPFSNMLAKGAVKAAERLDCDLFIFPGKYLGIEELYAQADAKYEYQYNALFDHAAVSGLDFMIAAVGTIAYALDDDAKLDFLRRFDNIPLLSVASQTDEYDYLIYDNKSGVTEAVEYLISEGRKHIGFMAGDLNNIECKLRYLAYRETLERHGLEYSDDLVTECDIAGKSLDKARELLKVNPDMDGVVCVNDNIAHMMYTAIKERGSRIGSDIAVVGFDDLPFAAELDPPLASVRADASMLGERAVEKAVAYLSGKEDNEHFVPTRFIPRESCSVLGELFNSPEKVFTGSREDAVRNMEQYLKSRSEYSNEQKNKVLMIFRRTIRFIENEFVRRVPDRSSILTALDIADSFFDSGCLSADILIRSYSMIDSAYRWFSDLCPPVSMPALHKLYEAFYRRVSSEIVQQYRSLQDMNNSRTHINNVFIRDTLMFDRTNLQDAYRNALKRLTDVGADTGFLYVLEKSEEYKSGERFMPERWLFKSYFYGSNLFSVPKNEQSMTPQQLYSHKYLPENRRYTLIAADLYSNEFQYGMALLEPRTTDFFDELELAVYQISSALRTIELLQKQEDMLTELHSRSLALDNLSKTDELTRLNNRRGFYIAAEELAESHKGSELIVCYADMDNLKLVNDRFGHTEGDYSIKLLADCMRYAFGESAVIGRMGGDEYAAVVLKEKCGSTDEIRRRKEGFLAQAAERDKKPFKVGLSLGLCECVCTDSYDLRAVIDKADGLLYMEKMKRKKEI